MSEPRPMTADEEATMREFAALNDSTRVTMTAIEAAQIIATIDALRSEPPLLHRMVGENLAACGAEVAGQLCPECAK